MMTVLISSNGAAWSFHAAMGDKVFLVETVHPSEEMTVEALEYLIREAVWLFGNHRRVVYLNRDDDWVEVLHDGAGNITGHEPYDGPIPEDKEEAAL